MNCCAYCESPVVDGIVRRGRVFCDEVCSDSERSEIADAWASSEGFSSYEDMQEHYGATVIESINPRRY